MPLYESTALTLKRFRLNEADNIVTLFTLDYGKVRAVAKGVLRQKSRLMGRTEPFLKVRAIFYGKDKAELYQVNSLDIVESFNPIREDYGKLSRAFVSAELVDACQKEKDTNPAGFRMLADLWRGLAEETTPLRQDLLLRLFEFRYLSLIGFQPTMGACVFCGGGLTGVSAGFNSAKGGAVCEKCMRKDSSSTRVSLGAVRLLAKSLETPPDKLSRLSAGPPLVAELGTIVKSAIETHVRRRMNSERFIRL
jgi:DNA repair protein RecO (recombination protein O)